MADSSTRNHIIDKAEILFAQHGIEAVSLREVCRAAGQKNVGAVQYHFGSKEDLLRAISEVRMAGYDARRLEMLKALKDSGGDDDLYSIVDAFVAPLAERLDQGAPEIYHILFAYQVQTYSSALHQELSETPYGEGIKLGVNMIRRILCDVPTHTVDQLLEFWSDLLLYSLAHRAHKLLANKVHANSNKKFVEELIGALTRILREE